MRKRIANAAGACEKSPHAEAPDLLEIAGDMSAQGQTRSSGIMPLTPS